YLKCMRPMNMHVARLSNINVPWRSDFTCAPGFEFRCPDSQLCLPDAFLCDGVTDCEWDVEISADEYNCTGCNNGAKMCNESGRCISSRAVCNGIV
ncbi:hypothetical protein PENTCL1PPCAC_7525, partial [Pristionchus entomophagus]